MANHSLAPSGQWSRVAVLVLAVGFALWALTLIHRTSFIATDGHRYYSLFDDAMISMRYAWNASHGSGLVWNPGERMEGYTNLLMVAFMTVWTWMLDKSSAVLAVQLSGIPVLLGIGVLNLLLWRELEKGGEVSNDKSFGSLAFIGALAYYPLAYWTLMGMETGLLALLLLAGTLLALIYTRTKEPSRVLAASLLFSLAYLARPDSAPVAVGVLVLATVLVADSWKRRMRILALALTIFALLPIAQVIFRGLYYGSLVPVTYTLKATGMPLGFRIQNGIGFILPYLRETRWVYVLAMAGAVLAFTRRLGIVAFVPLTLLAYQIVIGGDAWPYWRLVAPGLPYLIILSLAAADRSILLARRLHSLLTMLAERRLGPRLALVTGRVLHPPLSTVLLSATAIALVLAGILADYVRSGSPGLGSVQLGLIAGGILVGLVAAGARPASMAAAAGTIMLLMNINGRFLSEAFFSELPYKAEANRNHVNVALSILQFTTEEATVGVIQAGIIPYYTSRYGVDFLGKNDPYIASLPIDLQGGPAWYGMTSVPGHNKYDLEYSIVQMQPTYVEGFVWGSQDLTRVFQEQYVEISLPGPDPAFRRADPRVRWDLIPPDKIITP